ncbi:MAG: ATP-binding protein [Myxococcales bacterium]
MAASSRALVIAFLAVIGAFTASTIWVGRSARSIDADSILISRDAAPGIEVLSNLRAEMRTLEIEVLRAVDTRDPSRVAAARSRIDSLLSRALALPNDPREAELLGRLQAELRAFDEAVERAMEQSRSGQYALARRTLAEDARPPGDAAAAFASQLVDYNAEVTQRAAERIEIERARESRLAMELDAVSALLAVLAAFLALRIIRQAHRAHRERQEAFERKAEELEQFAGRVAHDILSPLSAVGMALALAERNAPHAKEALGRGSASLGRVRGIVDGLLEFARAGAHPEQGATADVPAVVAGLKEELTPFADERGALLHIEPPPACAVACSPGVLLSLLGNLLRNAVKYLGESTRREVTLRVRRRRGSVLFEVEDTGPGIPPTLGSRVFEPYVRGPNTGMPGIGLGLATVKRLVESHGGAVGVKPGSTGGALFWFELDESRSYGDTILNSADRADSARA